MKRVILIVLIAASILDAAAQRRTVNAVTDAGIIRSSNNLNNADTNYHGFMKAIPGRVDRVINGQHEWTHKTVSVLDYATGTSGIPNDTLSDDLAFQRALAAHGTVIVPPGNWYVNTNLTVTYTNKLIYELGAQTAPASGVIVAFNGIVEGHGKIFDESRGGRHTFKALGVGSPTTRTRHISSHWWGANGLNSSDETDALSRWANSAEPNSNTEHILEDGIYRVGSSLFCSNYFRGRGLGSAHITLTGSSHNAKVFTFVNGANNITLDNFSFGSVVTGTNESAVIVQDDVDWFVIQNCKFNGFKGPAIDIQASATSGSLYCRIENNQFRNGNNSSTNGNGLMPAWAIRTTNVFSACIIANNTVNGNDAAFQFHGGAATNSGRIFLLNNAVENCGRNGLEVTNTIEGINVTSLNIVGGHMEANKNRALVGLFNSKILDISKAMLAADKDGTRYSTNLVWIENVWKSTLEGNNFNNPVSNYVYNASSSIPVHLICNYYDTGAAGPASESIILSKIVGAYTVRDDRDIYSTPSASGPLIALGDDNSGIGAEVAGLLTLWVDGAAELKLDSGSFRPGVNRGQSIGSSGIRFLDGFYGRDLFLGAPGEITGQLFLEHASSTNQTVLKSGNGSQVLLLPSDTPAAGEVLKVTSYSAPTATLEWGAAGGGAGYTLPFYTPNISTFLSASTYYSGSDWTSPSTTFTNVSFTVPKTGTIKDVFLNIAISGTLATSENVTIYIDKNAGTTTTLTTSSQWNAARVKHHFSGLSTAVTAGDYLAIRIASPTWVTQPTNVRLVGYIYIE